MNEQTKINTSKNKKCIKYENKSRKDTTTERNSVASFEGNVDGLFLVCCWTMVEISLYYCQQGAFQNNCFWCSRTKKTRFALLLVHKHSLTSTLCKRSLAVFQFKDFFHQHIKLLRRCNLDIIRTSLQERTETISIPKIHIHMMEIMNFWHLLSHQTLQRQQSKRAFL